MEYIILAGEMNYPRGAYDWLASLTDRDLAVHIAYHLFAETDGPEWVQVLNTATGKIEFEPGDDSKVIPREKYTDAVPKLIEKLLNNYKDRPEQDYFD